MASSAPFSPSCNRYCMQISATENAADVMNNEGSGNHGKGAKLLLSPTTHSETLAVPGSPTAPPSPMAASLMRRDEMVQQALRMADAFRAETRREVDRVVRRVRKEYQAKLDRALQPKTLPEKRVRELEELVRDMRVKAAEDATAIAELHEELAQANSRLDNYMEEEEEDGDDERSGGDDAERRWGRKKRRLNSVGDLRNMLEEQVLVIEHLRECFTNASRLRDEAWAARDEARSKGVETERLLKGVQADSKAEIERLKEEVCGGPIFLFLGQQLHALFPSILCSSADRRKRWSARGCCAGARRWGTSFMKTVGC